MRHGLRRFLVTHQGLGAATPVPCTVSNQGNQAAAASIQVCGDAALNTVGSDIATQVTTSFNTLVNELKAGGAAGEGAAASVFTGFEIASQIGSMIAGGFTADMDLIIVNLANDITQATSAGMYATATTEVGLGAEFGWIGAIIGVIIAAITIIADVSNPHTVVTTYGVTVASSDYVNTNMKNAYAFLNNPNESTPPSGSLAGMTAIWFAKTFKLFLANPTWLWANQAYTGLCQPIPPEQGTGSPVDLVFTQLPGAFELLSRAQFAEACLLVSVSPSKLPLYMSIPNPVTAPGSLGFVYPDPNPLHYNPLWSAARNDAGDLGIVWSWVPDGPYAVPDQSGAGPGTAYYSFSNSPWQPWTAAEAAHYQQGIVNSTCPNSSAPVTGPPTIQGGADIGFDNGALYASCPNLVTNDNTTDSGNNITGQTDICHGIYFLQVMYPCLTADQCLAIQTANQGAYEAWIAKAQAWADTQCDLGLAARLVSGSQWNLEDADANAIIAAWKGPPWCKFAKPTQIPPPHSTIFKSGSPSTATSTATKVAKTIAFVGGLSVIGLALYAAKTSTPILKTTELAYGKAKRFAGKEWQAASKELKKVRKRV